MEIGSSSLACSAADTGAVRPMQRKLARILLPFLDSDCFTTATEMPFYCHTRVQGIVSSSPLFCPGLVFACKGFCRNHG